jgi:tetratricopeptide (TPR) repeat protein
VRRLLIPPILLLFGAAPPPEPETAPTNPHWCGDPVDTGDRARLLPGYGGGGFTIQTRSAKAQAYFNNGMQLAHAFAHKAAIEAFAEARRQDPQCAMCAWGLAWASGPTINYPIEAKDREKLALLTGTAAALAQTGPTNERALIAALKLRYADHDGNRAFAQAMDAMAKASPDDDEIAVVAADALMIDSDYKASNMPRPVALLEGVLKRNPDYTPAIHFYIHATELAGYPDRATPYADRLAALAPAASHLIHMPSHTYYWIGRYADAATANVRAVEIGNENAKRLKLPEPDGKWTLAYYGHNVVFGLGGALMADDAASGLTLARPVIAMAKRAGKLDMRYQHSVGEAYIAMARFAPVDETLAIPDPGTSSPIAQAFWHYARGEAFARTGNVEGILQEARAIPHALNPDPTGGAAPKLFKVSRLVLEGRAAMLRNKPAEAASAFSKAAAIEESRSISEASDPPLWWYPVRRDVAAALLADGNAKAALAAADASLKRRPRDAVALAVRAKAEDVLGNKQAAIADRIDARRNWRGSLRAIG